MRVRHEGLNRVVEIADGPAGDAQLAVMAESGWELYVPPEHTDPALAPDQPLPEPEPAKPKRASKTAPKGEDTTD